MPQGNNVHANRIRNDLLHDQRNGPPFLLIPGITSPAIPWAFVAERLAEAFDVHVIGGRGRALIEGRRLVEIGATTGIQPQDATVTRKGASTARRPMRF